MSKRAPQDSEMIFALDIGTRSIIGIVGRVEDERFRVLAVEKEEHGKRAMLDGQIEDIAQVAKVARKVQTGWRKSWTASSSECVWLLLDAPCAQKKEVSAWNFRK